MRRKTSQRQIIREVIQQADRPLSPGEICALAQADAPQLGIATVYRTLSLLLAEGWIEAVELPGEGLRYEVAGKAHHHHFRCRRCGLVFELEGCPGNMKALMPRGFTAESHSLVIYGVCANCTAARRAVRR